MASNRERQKRASFSVKSHIESRTVAGRGTWAVQLPDGAKFFKFTKEGTVRLDIVPYRTSSPKAHPHSVDGTWYERTYFIHRTVGADAVMVVCPKSTFGKPCPICEYRASLDKNDEEDAKIIHELRPQERQLFNVIVYENGKQSDVMVLDQPRSGLGRKIDDMVRGADEEDSHYQYYVDLENGSTLKVNVTEMFAGTFKYFGAASVEFKPRREAYDESILDKTVDLDAALNVVPYDELSDLLHGIGSHDPGNQRAVDDDEEPPEKPKKTSKPAASADDDEDEPPAKPAKAKSKPPVDDEDDDEPPAKPAKARSKPPVDDEEDDEPPAKPTKAKSKPLIDDEEDDEPPVKAKAKTKPPVDDEEEADEPPAKPKGATEPPKRVPIEDWDDEEDD